MKANEDELRSVIRRDKSIQEQARQSAKEFLNDNADSGMLIINLSTARRRSQGRSETRMQQCTQGTVTSWRWQQVRTWRNSLTTLRRSHLLTK
eukprot:3932619-Amphidinium_carterae.2